MKRTSPLARSFTVALIVISLASCSGRIGVTTTAQPTTPPPITESNHTPRVVRSATRKPAWAMGARKAAIPAGTTSDAASEIGDPPSTMASPGGRAGTSPHFAVTADLATLTGIGRSWFVPAETRPTATDLARIAKAFGVSGAVDALPADAGGGWILGTQDGVSPLVTVFGNGLWSYSTRFGSREMTGDCGRMVPATTVGAAVTPALDACPGVIDCPTPAKSAPTNLPTRVEALAKAKALFTALGSPDVDVEVTVDDTQVSIAGYILLDGFRSPVGGMFVSYGEGGVVESASGSIAIVQRGDEYPLVGTAAALARLNGEEFYGDPGTVTFSKVSRSLTEVYADDGTDLLLPAYTFSNDADESVTVVAIPDEYLQSTDSTVMVDPAIPVVSPEIPVVSPEIPVVSPDSSFACSESSVVPGLAVPPTPRSAPPVIDTTARAGNPTVDAAKILVGLTPDAAATKARSLGWTLRVSKENGEDLMVTADYSQTRVNVETAKGIVTAIRSIG